MMARKEAVRVARQLFDEHNGHYWHIGMVAIRQLLDAIYGGPPNGRQEQLMRNMPPRILDARDAQHVVDAHAQRVNEVKTRQHKYSDNCACQMCQATWNEIFAIESERERNRTITRKRTATTVKKRRKQ